MMFCERDIVMKESTKRKIAKVKCSIRDVVANYKGKPVSLREAVKIVNEYRRAKELAANKSSR